MSRHTRLSFMDALALEIRADRKTETRRLVRVAGDITYADRGGDGWIFWRTGNHAASCRAPCDHGDILDVCEALIPQEPTESAPFEWVSYRPDGLPVLRHAGRVEWAIAESPVPIDCYECISWPWKVKVLPARYCPAWAVRTHRRIVSVHPERLTEITDAGAVAEGIASLGWEPTREGFVRGFREMHGLAEDADPWVWVIRWAPGEASDV